MFKSTTTISATDFKNSTAKHLAKTDRHTVKVEKSKTAQAYVVGPDDFEFMRTVIVSSMVTQAEAVEACLSEEEFESREHPKLLVPPDMTSEIYEPVLVALLQVISGKRKRVTLQGKFYRLQVESHIALYKFDKSTQTLMLLKVISYEKKKTSEGE